MKSKTERARAIAGASALRSATVVSSGTVAADQDGQTVLVRMDGDVRTLDGSGVLEMPSRVADLKAGDDVAVTLRREPGKSALVPEVTGSYSASERVGVGIATVAESVPEVVASEMASVAERIVSDVNDAVDGARSEIEDFKALAGTTYATWTELTDTDGEHTRTIIGAWTNPDDPDAALTTKSQVRQTAGEVSQGVVTEFADGVGLEYSGGAWHTVSDGLISSTVDSHVSNALGDYYTKAEQDVTDKAIKDRVSATEETAKGAKSSATEAVQTANKFENRIDVVEESADGTKRELRYLARETVNGAEYGLVDDDDNYLYDHILVNSYGTLDIIGKDGTLKGSFQGDTVVLGTTIIQDFFGSDNKHHLNFRVGAHWPVRLANGPRPLYPQVVPLEIDFSGDGATCDIEINAQSFKDYIRDMVLDIAYPVGSILFRQWGSQYDPANDGMPGTWRQVAVRLCSRTLWEGKDGYAADSADALTFSDSRGSSGNRLTELTQYDTNNSWADWYLASHDLTSGGVAVLGVWKRIA